ncbi:unnamed protein product, partial [Haemonchus placei]|uniref:Pept_C1 domain-containing protein n=1 Tax=Haemonchus placei TaxID=6290 RepID=A0A0N4X838_HAEPC
FDARTHWPNCSSLTHIRDQANCGSCWAVSTASALSDRICIASNGEMQMHISSIDFVSCCNSCGFGCDGGWPIAAFDFYTYEGAVTGGDYGAKDGCRPYPFHPCGHHGNDTYYGECSKVAKTPKCRRRCQRNYKQAYYMDKSYGEDAYEVPHSVKAIQREIMKNGPVVSAFTVYEDFSYYKKGIYKHPPGRIGSLQITTTFLMSNHIGSRGRDILLFSIMLLYKKTKFKQHSLAAHSRTGSRWSCYKDNRMAVTTELAPFTALWGF